MAKKIKNLLILSLLACLLGVAPALALAVSEENIESSFKAFQETWLKKLAAHGNYGPGSAKIEKLEDGKVVGEYKVENEKAGKSKAGKNKIAKDKAKKDKVEKDKAEEGKVEYIATYRELGKPQSSRIRKTDKKGSPYVGVFSYEEIVYSNKGNTPEEASKGPFKCEKTVTITEIFPFSNGKWVY